jgi:hypothetical protein
VFLAAYLGTGNNKHGNPPAIPFLPDFKLHDYRWIEPMSEDEKRGSAWIIRIDFSDYADSFGAHAGQISL